MKNGIVLLLLPVMLLNACGEVLNVRTSTVEYLGRSYTVTTETIQSGNRTYDVSRVRVNGRTVTCLVDSPGDCEAAVEQAINAVKGGDR